MISSALVEQLLHSVFIDSASPFLQRGFELSLHKGGAAEAIANEITGQNYSRVPVGCGPDYWALGSRVVISNTDLTFPPTDPTETIRGIRTLVVWGVEHAMSLFVLTLDEPGINVGAGDALVIPAGGLVIGFG